MSPEDRALQEILEAWDGVPEDSKVHVAAIVRSLAARFTGRIMLDCNQGGVGDHHQTRNLTAKGIRAEYEEARSG